MKVICILTLASITVCLETFSRLALQVSITNIHFGRLQLAKKIKTFCKIYKTVEYFKMQHNCVSLFWICNSSQNWHILKDFSVSFADAFTVHSREIIYPHCNLSAAFPWQGRQGGNKQWCHRTNRLFSAQLNSGANVFTINCPWFDTAPELRLFLQTKQSHQQLEVYVLARFLVSCQLTLLKTCTKQIQRERDFFFFFCNFVMAKEGLSLCKKNK